MRGGQQEERERGRGWLNGEWKEMQERKERNVWGGAAKPAIQFYRIRNHDRKWRSMVVKEEKWSTKRRRRCASVSVMEAGGNMAFVMLNELATLSHSEDLKWWLLNGPAPSLFITPDTKRFLVLELARETSIVGVLRWNGECKSCISRSLNDELWHEGNWAVSSILPELRRTSCISGVFNLKKEKKRKNLLVMEYVKKNAVKKRKNSL